MTGCPLLDSEYAARQNGKRLPCERLAEENAKLRELCADLLKGFDCGWPSDVCGDCERDGTGMPIGGCKLENRARELGVEVDA